MEAEVLGYLMRPIICQKSGLRLNWCDLDSLWLQKR